MKRLYGVLFGVVLVAACLSHNAGFGPGDPWSTVGGSPGGLISNYAGPAAAPALRSLDGGVQANTVNCANDGTLATIQSTAAGLDLGDSGVIGNACGGILMLFLDGGEIGTSTAVATINLPYFYQDAGIVLDAGNALSGNGGFSVDCKHGKNLLGLTEGPVELGTAVYCAAVAGDGGNSGASNQFNVYLGPNPLGASGILGTIAHDGGPGLVEVQYSIVGWP
jgi:hypothetical protein